MRSINEREQKEEIIYLAIKTVLKVHIIEGDVVCKPYVFNEPCIKIIQKL